MIALRVQGCICVLMLGLVVLLRWQPIGDWLVAAAIFFAAAEIVDAVQRRLPRA